jgi:hypothetical protein
MTMVTISDDTITDIKGSLQELKVDTNSLRINGSIG